MSTTSHADKTRRLGHPVAFDAPVLPGQPAIEAPWIGLQRLDAARHADDLFKAQLGHDWLWDYMSVGPYSDVDDFRDWILKAQQSLDPCFYAIVDPATGSACGMASFLRIDAAMGVIEIGFILLTPVLQRRREASAALMAMIRWCFDAGYRRVEWKCNALNLPSQQAAIRLGFTYEGRFRNHMISKGRNRDTDWFSITSEDWGALQPAYDRWLSSANFDAEGQQRLSLSDLTAAALPGRRAP